MNMPIFRRSLVVVVSQSNRNCDIGFKRLNLALTSGFNSLGESFLSPYIYGTVHRQLTVFSSALWSRSKAPSNFVIGHTPTI